MAISHEIIIDRVQNILDTVFADKIKGNSLSFSPCKGVSIN